jgi:small-conductance mechanosensitive channel
MARMQEIRADARRACPAHRERASASPAPVAAPLLYAAAIVPSAALVSDALGLSTGPTFAVAGGAVVLAAVVAHRTVASVLAGLALLLIRPYAPGERVRLHSPAHGGHVDAEIVRIGLANTTLATSSGVLVVPNSLLLKDAPDRAGTC